MCEWTYAGITGPRFTKGHKSYTWSYDCLYDLWLFHKTYRILIYDIFRSQISDCVRAVVNHKSQIQTLNVHNYNEESCYSITSTGWQLVNIAMPAISCIIIFSSIGPPNVKLIYCFIARIRCIGLKLYRAIIL